MCWPLFSTKLQSTALWLTQNDAYWTNGHLKNVDLQVSGEPPATSVTKTGRKMLESLIGVLSSGRGTDLYLFYLRYTGWGTGEFRFTFNSPNLPSCVAKLTSPFVSNIHSRKRNQLQVTPCPSDTNRFNWGIPTVPVAPWHYRKPSVFLDTSEIIVWHFLEDMMMFKCNMAMENMEHVPIFMVPTVVPLVTSWFGNSLLNTLGEWVKL